jgi:SAM-dependent methyltransferase
MNMRGLADGSSTRRSLIMATATTQKPAAKRAKRDLVPKTPAPDLLALKKALYAEYAATYDSDREKFVCAEAMERRLHFFCEAARNGDKILDLGCGTGAFLEPIARRYPKSKITGLDLSPDMLKLAAARTKGLTNVELREADLSGRFPLDDESFDVVLASNVNYEMPDLELFMREVWRVLKSYPVDRESPQFAAGFLCLRDNSPVNVEYAAIARDVLTWNLVTCDEIIETVHGSGLRIVGHRPVFIGNVKFNEAILKKQVKFGGYYRVYDELARRGYDPSSVQQGHIWVHAVKPPRKGS